MGTWGSTAAHDDSERIAIDDMKNMINQVVPPKDRGTSWYRKAMATIDKPIVKGKFCRIGKFGPSQNMQKNYLTSKVGVNIAEEYLNKPLPPLPQSPYFEYMFADAGIESKKPSAQSSDDDHGGLGELAAQFAITPSGVDISTKATQAFYNNFKAAGSPTSFYGNVQQRPGSELIQCEFSYGQTHPKQNVILAPKSQKSKAGKTNGFFPSSTFQQMVTAPAVKYPSSDTIQRGASNDNASKLCSHMFPVTKRSARDSFVTMSTPNGSNGSPYLLFPYYKINLLSTKKIRVALQQIDQDVEPMRAVSIYSIPSTPTYSVITIDSDDDDVIFVSERKLPRAALTGYSGQFESYETEILLPHARSHSPCPFTTGDPLHANNEFTHINFIPCPIWPATDYTRDNLSGLPGLTATLIYAEKESQRAAQRLTCTPSEENLRREVHLECASARLEGVAVGQYRYYQGHMSLEEYKAARMCICWDFCWCSKLCTIYADVKCPCSKWIVLHKD
ncbi:uncharacterized protein Z518_03078 [Rhinocladiella mackenziei CBS 650.93]|uniref:Rhinocladiella mackenziei CBS 650.93 unplaced genomic scaffold supercont1.2, whole genome shotgun sequence n=1 Tax=Rhinocladiella mackenziei CBS 650.93 TaxID=1442369 RepID=A0A0D2G1P3_9EURO|nr:uncharacterized protein Z518_03078 [Rhinocladiella mackenziei CBS 650.93]KIX08422.1 hypothetical protein Z518_03078 [Rhinocladiella mackenziei CBS 650.93]